MSRPVLSGEQLQVAVDAGVLRVTNDPGFSTDNADGAPYRAVLLIADRIVFGREAPVRTQPDDRWPGMFATRSDLAMWRIALPPGQYLLRVYGGSLFEPWVPGQEGPFVEWGYTDQGKNPSGVPRTNEVKFTVAAATPPSNERQELVDVLVATRQVNAASLPFKAGWKAAKTVDTYLADAIGRARRLP